jgi:hypothetical protein
MAEQREPRAEAKLQLRSGAMVAIDLPASMSADDFCELTAWLMGPARKQLEARQVVVPEKKLYLPE